MIDDLKIPKEFSEKILLAAMGGIKPIKTKGWKCNLYKNGKLVESSIRQVEVEGGGIRAKTKWPAWEIKGGGDFMLVVLDPEGDAAAFNHYEIRTRGTVTIGAPQEVMKIS